jgi:hypothetical protein
MTLMEKARSMHSGVGLIHEFWAEAVGIGCYLVDRSPSSTLDDKTPHEVWTSKKPSFEHLRVFVCDAYVHVLKENRSKSVYYVSFIDDFSSNTWIYFLRNKFEVFDRFKEFKALVENQTMVENFVEMNSKNYVKSVV